MPDTFVHFKGIKNDCARDDKNPNYVSHKFVCRHENAAEFKKAFDFAMSEVFQMQGLICVKDETKSGADLNNLYFVPLHMLARIEFETKPLTGEYPVDVQGATKQ